MTTPTRMEETIMTTKSTKPSRAKKTTTSQKSSKKTTTSTDDAKTITIVPDATIPFRDGSIRYQRWECVRDGATVGETIKAIEKKGLKRARRFIVKTCVEKGLLTI